MSDEKAQATETTDSAASGLSDVLGAWRPIETAPKDSSEVLLYCENTTVKTTGGYWSDHPKCRCWIAGGYMQKVFPPEWWMPIPDAPNV